MKRLIRNGAYAMRLHVIAASVSLVLSSVSAVDETLDVQALLPLFEQNTLGRKTLDVSYSLIYEQSSLGKASSGKSEVRLIFDAETEHYREEKKFYDSPDDNTDSYRIRVQMWDGKEYVEWNRVVRKTPGFRAIRPGVYEHPGDVWIGGQPFQKIPRFASFYYGASDHPLAKTIPKKNPSLGSLAGDTVIIETQMYKFVFSKKTCALEKYDFYNADKDNKMVPIITYEFLNHVECSGVWIPLRAVETYRHLDGSVWFKGEYTVDPKKLRLLDKADDPSVFHAPTLPAGCSVDDQIRKTRYTVTTLDTLPNDVEAITKMLEKLLEQADEQKAAIEEEIKAKKKKK